MKAIIRAAFLVTSFVAPMAVAGGTPGSKGTVTAYEADKQTVIRADACAATKLSYDYAGCGKRLREDVKELLCKRGKGYYKWWYQVSDSKLMAQTTSCK